MVTPKYETLTLEQWMLSSKIVNIGLCQMVFAAMKFSSLYLRIIPIPIPCWLGLRSKTRIYVTIYRSNPNSIAWLNNVYTCIVYDNNIIAIFTTFFSRCRLYSVFQLTWSHSPINFKTASLLHSNKKSCQQEIMSAI